MIMRCRSTGYGAPSSSRGYRRNPDVANVDRKIHFDQKNRNNISISSSLSPINSDNLCIVRPVAAMNRRQRLRGFFFKSDGSHQPRQRPVQPESSRRKIPNTHRQHQSTTAPSPSLPTGRKIERQQSKRQHQIDRASV
ncbi:hypothetical protein ACLOJK_023294 [Asimina triloba]